MTEDIKAQIARLESEVSHLSELARGVEGRIREVGSFDTRLTKVEETSRDHETRLTASEVVINMSKGALWLLLKIASVGSLVVAAFVWIWEQVAP